MERRRVRYSIAIPTHHIAEAYVHLQKLVELANQTTQMVHHLYTQFPQFQVHYRASYTLLSEFTLF